MMAAHSPVLKTGPTTEPKKQSLTEKFFYMLMAFVVIVFLTFALVRDERERREYNNKFNAISKHSSISTAHERGTK